MIKKQLKSLLSASELSLSKFIHVRRTICSSTLMASNITLYGFYLGSFHDLVAMRTERTDT